jgi:hypothetical protein
MSYTQRFSDNYKLESIGGSGTVEIEATSLTVTGNLVVSGSSTEVNSTDLAITDKTIVLNKGEAGAGVTSPVHSGIEIERGSLTNVGVRYNDTSDRWELTNDGSSWSNILSGASVGILNVVEDTTPQLGGALDVNGMSIISASNGDIVIDPNGSGQLKINHEVSLQEQGSDPSSTSSYNKLYAKTPSEGGSGVFFVNSTTSDELVSKTKAMVFALIF